MSGHSAESTEVLTLMAACVERDGALDVTALESCERELVRAAGEMAAECRKSADSPEEHRQQYDALHAHLWATLEAWGALRSRDDVGREVEAVGRWELTAAESLWVNTGFVDARLYASDADTTQITRTLTELVGKRSQPDLTILDFCGALLADFRRRLGVDDILQRRAESAEHSQREQQFEAEVARMQAEQREFLESMDETRELVLVQAQIQELSPFIARLTGARGAGASSTDLRVEMKARETMQRLYMKVHGAISNYSKRKTYEERHKEMLRTLGEALALKDQQAGAIAGAHDGFDAEAVERAYRDAFRQLRRQLHRLSRSDTDGEPPFLLEREPRLTAAMVEERWKHVLGTCPRFASSEQSGPEGRARVLLLPGKGNPMVDRETGDVLASLFPIEVKLTSISTAIAESYFAQDADLRQTFALASGVPASEEGNLREAFRKTMGVWLRPEGGSGGALDARVDKWCKQQLLKS